MHDPSKLQFPPPPREDLSLTSSSLTPVNGHVQCQFSHKTGKWSAPAFIPDPFLRVHGLAPVFNYESVNLAVALNAEFVPSHESHGMLYIRPILFGSSACIQLTPPDEYTFCVYVTPAAAYHGINPLDALILEEFDRAAPRGTGSGKVGGNYAPVMKWSDQARREGFAITLHLDSASRSEVEEFSTAGFVGIKKEADGEGVAVVVPDSGNVVDSVTVRCILAVAERMGWAAERRVIKYEELASFSEVLACGTAVTVIPIKSITCKSRGDRFTYLEGNDGKPGPYAAKLAATLGDIQKGKVEDEFGWVVTSAETR
ncbi:hypothetical protein BDW71DRAFT_200951 [Aspergillus fruticulosus]